MVYGSSPHLGAALAGWLIATVRRAPFVLEVRDLWPQILADSGMLPETSLVYRGLKVLERFLYRRADAIVVLARGSAGVIAGEGIDEAKIHFLPNGAEPADFEVDEPRKELRQELGFEGIVVVYAGAHGPANGLDLALDAAEKLADTKARFVFIGDGVAKAELMADAEARGLANVEFRDPIPKAEIPRVFAAADIGLHCLADVPLFRHGVSPNKLYDYMAAGVGGRDQHPGRGGPDGGGGRRRHCRRADRDRRRGPAPGRAPPLDPGQAGPPRPSVDDRAPLSGSPGPPARDAPRPAMTDVTPPPPVRPVPLDPKYRGRIGQVRRAAKVVETLGWRWAATRLLPRGRAPLRGPEAPDAAVGVGRPPGRG